jgi:PTH1 family peptidyl-tRNA hydrolase
LKLVVGLGNPGRRYLGTRHNVGFRIVERLAERAGIALDASRFQGRFGRGRLTGIDLGLLEPETFMNVSGDAVAEALRLLPVGDPAQDLVLVLDDVDLPFGRIRIRPGGGDGGHRGLRDVTLKLGRNDFARLRFGIGRPEGPFDTSGHVLARFSAEEERELPGLLDLAADAVATLLRDGAKAAMNRFNAPRRSVDESSGDCQDEIDKKNGK